MSRNEKPVWHRNPVFVDTRFIIPTRLPFFIIRRRWLVVRVPNRALLQRIAVGYISEKNYIYAYLKSIRVSDITIICFKLEFRTFSSFVLENGKWS